LTAEQLEQWLREPPPVFSADIQQEPESKTATRHFGSRTAGEIVFIGDAPKRDEDFLRRAELAFILAARLNRIWDEMNPCTGQEPILAPECRRAWNRIVRRENGTRDPRQETILAATFWRASNWIIGREHGTSAYQAGFVVHLDAPWGGGKTTFANYVGRILNP